MLHLTGDTSSDDVKYSQMFKKNVQRLKPHLIVIVIKAERFPSGESRAWAHSSSAQAVLTTTVGACTCAWCTPADQTMR